MQCQDSYLGTNTGTNTGRPNKNETLILKVLKYLHKDHETSYTFTSNSYVYKSHVSY